MSTPKWKNPIEALFVPVKGPIRLVTVAEHWDRETWRKLLDVETVERDRAGRKGLKFYGDDWGRGDGKQANRRASLIAGSLQPDYLVGDVFFVAADSQNRDRSVTNSFILLALKRAGEPLPA